MTPEQALECQIARYQQMTVAERIMISLRLHEMASEMARAGIRMQHPNASTEEVEELLRARRRLVYSHD